MIMWFKYKWTCFLIWFIGSPISFPYFYIEALSAVIYIYYRLRSHTNVKKEKIINRFRSYKKYYADKKLKESYIKRYKAMVEYSEKTGIPQWNLRTMFRID